ncbi:hypothetical protein [Pseudomonas fluorescens group sp. PF-69]
MKTYRLVRESQVRCIDSPTQAEAMLASDYLLVRPRARGKDAKRMRELNNHRRAEGWTTRTLWFSPMDLAAVRAALLPGETYAELFLRLVRKNSLLL